MKKIKLAILDNDMRCLKKITTTFETKYSDEVEVHSFSDLSAAMDNLEKSKIDIFIANDSFDIDISSIPKRCGFAYFVDAADVTKVRDQQAISKFQKYEQIFKQILSLYSETADNVSGMKLNDDNCQLVFFSSPCGGVGTSSMAAACAQFFSNKGERVLYLNLERFGSADVFFHAEGQFDMSDVIFALKSKKANFTLKLESNVKRDPKGVFFYSQSKIALDMLELNCDEMVRLISELRLTGSYDLIVVDLDYSMDENNLKLYGLANSIIWVGDGSEISNQKIIRAYQALSILDDSNEYSLTSRCFLIYNKFSNKTSKAISNLELKNIGGAPRYEHASAEQVIEQLVQKNFFEQIL